ncbi:hypothetical protein RFN25_08395 [Mesorhizobium abyssinicae]|uniref:Uncharacterized protein n=1 Tax=Mesorhizobium abyssinicae TaxID=1209958 RepID=A0ABU5AX40_9HYPH|nr:hypothetical protein [Mesorhizobium abyssinicae]MDX8433451.1 hypothetical protein [Mesorhizobium abyssinicae]MDX8541778.1 hypothetical protein [Mesorhizobium abyssinicae]
MGVTYKSVQERLREAGIVMSKKGEVHRINYFGGLEETALYTTSLEEALTMGSAWQGRSVCDVGRQFYLSNC